jgi:hypothetical protein
VDYPYVRCFWDTIGFGYFAGKAKKNMSEYGTFIVLFAFVGVVYLATIIWTEKLFPERELDVPEEFEKLVLIKAAQIIAASRQMGLFKESEEEDDEARKRRRAELATARR